MKERQQLSRKREKRIKSIEQKQILSELQEQEKQRLKKEDEKQKRHQELEEEIEQMKKRNNEREESKIQEQQRIKELKSKKPMYVSMNEQYQNEEKNQLEEKKKKLAQIRNLAKPIRLEDILQHEAKHQDQLKAILLRNSSATEKFVYQKPFTSEAYKKIQEDYQHQKSFQEADKRNPQEIMNEYVKNNVKKPKIDADMITQREQTILKLKHQPVLKIRQDILESNSGVIELGKYKFYSNRIGQEYLQQSKKLTVQKKNDHNQSAENQSVEDIPNKKKQKTREQAKSVHQFVKIDYLKEMKALHNNKRQSDNCTNDGGDITNDWKKVLQQGNLSEQEKNQNLMKQAEKLEEFARRKEKLSKIKGKLMDKKDEEDIDNYYISSIQAKLAILDTNGGNRK